MLRLPLGPSLENMLLAKPVSDVQGRILLAAGVRLTRHFIARLSELGFHEVYVEYAPAEDVVERSLLHEATRREAVLAIEAAMKSRTRGSRFPVEEVGRAVEAVLREVELNRDIVAGLTMLKDLDGYTFLHSVNVCALSLLISMGLGIRGRRLREVGVGALLHDLGKVSVPAHILRKPGGLTPAELLQARLHPDWGYEALREVPSLGEEAAQAAYQHHERMDGSGYPRGLRGEEIAEIGRIVAVADSYDAMTSDRVYQGKKLPHQACEELAGMAGRSYEGRVVETFLAHVAVYPEGTFLRLADGGTGLVLRQTEQGPLYPLVRVLADPEGEALPAGAWSEVVANAAPATVVVGILEEEEVAVFLRRMELNPVD